MIPFNRPYLTGKETEYIRQVVAGGKLSGNGEYTKRCQGFLEDRYGFRKCLLTTSGTDALEMAALLTGVGPGDEVIVPSYTFVSTALAFLRCGAKVVFADSRDDEPNVDVAKLEALVTPRTKVIVPVHYAGCACDMDAIMAIANRHGLLVVEDAAQAVDGYYLSAPATRDASGAVRRPLGGIGHIGCFSFHETKNIVCGEGGLLAINDERFVRRAEILWEKGTNRAEFFRGEVNKYGWVDIGSSFLPTELVAAFLWAQLEHLDEIQDERKRLWRRYWDFFSDRSVAVSASGAERYRLPKIPDRATNNAHMFYLLFPDLAKRSDFIAKMKAHDVSCVFHYLPLHSSEYYRDRHDGRALPNCDRYADTLVRMPLYCGLGSDQDKVFAAIKQTLAG